MITRVAIQFQGQVYSLPRPCRHKDVMQMIFDKTHQLVADETYGFLDDQDNFLDRKAVNPKSVENIIHSIDAGALMAVNDNIHLSDADRERQITDIFARHGVEVEFIN